MEPNRRVILILNIKIDSNRTAELKVYADDEPENVAAEFCRKQGLPDSVSSVLTKKIEDNLDVFIGEEFENSTAHLTSFGSGLEKANSQHFRSASAKNYGQVLYEKGILMKQKVEESVKVMKQNLLENEMKNLTFKPTITQYNRKNRPISSGVGKRQQKVADEDKVCTFKPKINKTRFKSGQSVAGKDRCIELFNSAAIMKQKREEKGKQL
jgi:hypothetical protein